MIPSRKPVTAVAVVEQPETALATVEPVVNNVANAALALKKTIQESKEESVMAMLEEAYKNSSKLILTKEEQSALLADFPDKNFQRGAGGDRQLIYLEHEALRNRLASVIGLGQFKQVIRKSWEEDFLSGHPPSPSKRIYIDMVLVVRGCAVAEAIGSGVYLPKNPRDTYGDGFEKAKTNAFRLCCKEWGIGLQCYSKDFCEEWKAKYPGFERPKNKT